jgi:hypothetical protein
VSVSCVAKPRREVSIQMSGSNNVERIAAERIGRETVTYVSNIYKYYVTYLLIQGEYIHRRQLKKTG